MQRTPQCLRDIGSALFGIPSACEVDALKQATEKLAGLVTEQVLPVNVIEDVLAM